MRLKMICLFFGCFLSATITLAQSNTFPSSGNVGIGILGPEFNIDIWKKTPRIRLLENDGAGNRRRLQISVAEFGNEISFLSTYGSGGNYPFVFRFGGSVSEVMRITTTGNVGIGTTSPQAKLAVNGNILAKEIKVETSGWSDFVFEPSYKLPDLKETEQFIKENKHLPEIPSAAEVAENGINLGEMNAKLLQKIEELTLYLIEKDKQVTDLQDRVKALEGKK